MVRWEFTLQDPRPNVLFEMLAKSCGNWLLASWAFSLTEKKGMWKIEITWEKIPPPKRWADTETGEVFELRSPYVKMNFVETWWVLGFWLMHQGRLWWRRTPLGWCNGSHAGLRNRCRKACEFESRHPQ